jgi:SAM-dependent methyltransferase
MSDAGASPELQRFVAEMPTERGPILAFMQEAAAQLEPGSRVLDAGAGNAPYRELFGHCRYVTSDWSSSQHEGAEKVDIQASLDDLPVPDASFDAVLNTQVLEHVADPVRVAGELFRVLAPGGRVWLTAPLVWPLHEEPFDYWRFTSHGLRRVLEEAGFRVERLEPRGGYFSAVATLLAGAPWWTAPGPPGAREPLRRGVAFALRLSAPLVRRLDPLDGQRALTLGYACVALKAA